jgi:hypothetical protein
VISGRKSRDLLYGGSALKAELEAHGINSKSWRSAAGRLIGGKPFSRGALYLILQSRTYRGEIDSLC